LTTEILPAGEKAVALAAQLLRAGQPVAIPTETVYGLAANALDAEAAARVFEAKGRPKDNPMIVHIDMLDRLPQVVSAFPREAQLLADAFWPGPLTLVLPKAAGIPDAVSAGLATVGVRLPAHRATRAVIAAAGLPLAAPSANRSGRPSPTSARHVWHDMAGRIPLILDGGDCPVGVESTVVSLAGGPTVLRPGFVTAEEIAAVLDRPVATADGAHYAHTQAPPSPGMKYRHYAPEAELLLLDGTLEQFIHYLQENAAEKPGACALCFAGEEARLPLPALAYGQAGEAASQAAGLYAALRRLDAEGAKYIYARMPAGGGVGQAVRNRLLRAADFNVISL